MITGINLNTDINFSFPPISVFLRSVKIFTNFNAISDSIYFPNKIIINQTKTKKNPLLIFNSVLKIDNSVFSILSNYKTLSEISVAIHYANSMESIQEISKSTSQSFTTLILKKSPALQLHCF